MNLKTNERSRLFEDLIYPSEVNRQCEIAKSCTHGASQIHWVGVIWADCVRKGIGLND